MATEKVKKPANPRASFIHKTLITVFLALLIDILAFTIILPLYPRILAHYEKVDGADEASLYYQIRTIVQRFRESLGIEGTRLDIVLFGGALGSMFSFLQFVSSPAIGRLSDKYGRRTILLISMVGNALSMLLWIFSKSFTTFVLSRIVGGLTEGNVQMSIAMISDVTTTETRSRGLALVGIAFSLGFTVGPPLGAYFTSYHLHDAFPSLSWLPINEYSSPALFAFILILIETAYLFIALPETLNFKSSPLGQTAPPPATPTGLPKSANSQPPQKTASLTLLSTIHFLFLFVFSGMEFTLTFLTHDRFSFSHAQQGRLLGLMGILSALVQGGYVRRYAHKYVPERDIVAQGIAAASAGLAVVGWGDKTVRSLYLAAAFLAFTSGTVVTSLTALASGVGKAEEEKGGVGKGEVGEEKDQGHVLGKFRSAGQLGRCLGPIFACSAYWVLGGETAYRAGAGALMVLAVLVVLVVPKGAKKVPVVSAKKSA
ncbi:hypothetical protein HK097_009404 [Rhizophlyctis rosea]|uniref:Major facilitator superfamily (MFS) profile domain-containing protein n=1 Tax=Rhizophlyctis rosea TaxID=64517 RepID=A0AAD5X593_9FUNG|nr:hypothetical protein HK097_009404 [Rhizophlyctis rosea]